MISIDSLRFSLENNDLKHKQYDLIGEFANFKS